MDLDFQRATGDQYSADVSSRYPIFSDVNTRDYMLIGSRQQKNASNSTYEDILRAEQLGLSAKMQQFGINPNYNPRDKVPMYTQTAEQRMLDYKPCDNRSDTPRDAKKKESKQHPQNISIDSNTILFIFIFLTLVFICFCFARTISDIKTQLKSLKELLKSK